MQWTWLSSRQLLGPNLVEGDQEHEIEDRHQEKTNGMCEIVDVLSGDALSKEDAVVVDVFDAYAAHSAMRAFWVIDIAYPTAYSRLRYTSCTYHAVIAYFIFLILRHLCRTLLFHRNLRILIEQLLTQSWITKYHSDKTIDSQNKKEVIPYLPFPAHRLQIKQAIDL